MRHLGLFILVMGVAFASSAKSYKISGKVYEFHEIKGVYAHGCEKDCLAISSLKKLKKLPKQSKGLLKSKASLICGSSGGKAVFGVDSKKNMMAFCLFKDDSLVEYQSLEKLDVK